MLTAMAGNTQGVAKSVNPILVNWDWEDGPQWMVVALDWILHDWIGRATTLDPSLAPLAVLSISFGVPASQGALPSFFESNLSAILRRIVTSGVLPFVSAGNIEVIDFSTHVLGTVLRAMSSTMLTILRDQYTRSLHY
jgi:hypothetical protein